MTSVSKYLSFVKKLKEFMENYTVLMTAKKVPYVDFQAQLATGEADVAHKSGIQATIETSHKNATKDTQDALHLRYNEASSIVDAIAGLIGKTSNEAAQLYAIRAELTGGHRGGGDGPASSSSSSSGGGGSSSSSSSSHS